MHKMTGNKKHEKSACKGVWEVLVYSSPLKNSGAATEDFHSKSSGKTDFRP